MSDSEAPLDLERFRAGDLDTFRRFVEHRSRDVFALAFRLTGSESDADDVVQEAFLKVWNRRETFQGRSELGSWLYRIATNCAYDLLRRRRRLGGRETPIDSAPEATTAQTEAPEPGLVVGHDLRRGLSRAMADLSAVERSAFVLRHLEQQSLADIGELLGLGTSATKNAIFRAVRKVRHHLQPLVEGSP